MKLTPAEIYKAMRACGGIDGAACPDCPLSSVGSAACIKMMAAEGAKLVDAMAKRIKELEAKT